MRKKKVLTLALAAVIAAGSLTTPTMQAARRANPFLNDYKTKFEIPPFDKIQYADYLEAVNAGIEQHNKEIAAITDNPAEPTFENTMLALDKSGAILERVMYVFSTLEEANSTPELVELAEKIYPLYSAHGNEISMNDKLFARVKKLYENRDKAGYTTAQKRIIEESYKSFARNGALLPADKKEQLKALNLKLSELYLKFNKNLLNATNAFSIVVDDKSELSGLPESVVAVAAEEAKSRGLEGKWVLTLHAPCRLPVLQYADSRQLRKKMYEGYTSLAFSGEYDNQPVINEILRTRIAKANLLGYHTYGDYMTERVMAKTVKAAEDLLLQIWKPAVARAKEEIAEMQAIVNRNGGGFKIAAYDYYYYLEKVRQEKYALDEDVVRQYFPVDNVREGIFYMAGKLYGVSFTEIKDAPRWHKDMKVYEVKDADGKHVAVFMCDYFSRAEKRQGAWMSELKASFIDDNGKAVRPIIYNVCNFSKPTADTPSLLSIDDVETMFHEFGHALHGMLSRAKYKSQSGTNVDRDFVELPSQIHEHWAFEPEVLRVYARHYKTGEVIPEELVKKIQEAANHGQGFSTTELVGAALLDLQYAKLTSADNLNIPSFELGVARTLNMPEEIQFRYRSTYFKHIFGSDGYASGYYTYLWAEVLDSDGFELFKERGIFDPETAKSFKTNVLEMGGSDDPMELYKRFRGHAPEVDALLRNRGLK